MTAPAPAPAASGAALTRLRQQMRDQALRPEQACVEQLLSGLEFSHAARRRAQQLATALVSGAREHADDRPALDSFLQEFGLSNEEGVALMCLAEGLLRIPDDATADQLIAEKIAAGQWASHAGRSDSSFVNAATWGLMLTGSLVQPPAEARENTGAWVQKLSHRLSAPAIRLAFRRAMQIIGGEFVAGQTIEKALARSRRDDLLQLCSYDMLGEGARTWADAQRYLQSYEQALKAISQQPAEALHERSSLSVKLSALEPRYDLLHQDQVLRRLAPAMQSLARQAAAANVGLTIDAEEADRLDLSLDIIETLARDPQTSHWGGLGVVVQAYGKRAPVVIDWLATLARDSGRQICIRLVKGAYWDAEIKRAQERGLPSYPVYTRKATTDVAYLACAEQLFKYQDVIYPQFATHNAHTLASVLAMRPPGAQFEFQRLHGMGGLLYEQVRKQVAESPRIRTYAPVGSHEQLLSYLVRRLLENGANSSFVNRFMDEQVPVAEVVADPVSKVEALDHAPNPQIPLPPELFGASRENSLGVDWGNPDAVAELQSMTQRIDAQWLQAQPSTLAGKAGAASAVINPATGEQIGEVVFATAADIDAAFKTAAKAQPDWNAAGAQHRAQCLINAAEQLREKRQPLIHLLVREAGKTLADAIAEVREAEDFLRYYASQAREHFSTPLTLPGPTGETNELHLHGRGVFVCISPWNFPLAIFLGQISAALAAGNAVVAKPAESTPLVAALAVQLLHASGVPKDVLHYMPAEGKPFGEAALSHPALAGVAMTGSTATAQFINRTLAARDGAILPFIAETGGLNAMIVDSSALPEQVVDDVIASAFLSAGQRCSALRLLFVQEDIADGLIEMIAGAMDELVVGDPAQLDCDVGPIITQSAADKLGAHCQSMQQQATLVKRCDLSASAGAGSFLPPHLFALQDAQQLQREEFGPILHVVRYRSSQLDAVLASIRNSGYGLTLGVHSRIEALHRRVINNTAIGNTYINRNIIGAVVGVQPFGGEGLSGTGPKAGGPHYLLRFASERTVTNNIVATGGNAQLLTLGGG